LDQTGIDYTVLYPSLGLYVMGLDKDEFRIPGCRAINQYSREIVRDFSDRMTTVAVIPMHTPDEAIEELEYAVNSLGFKAVTLQSHIVRPVPKIARDYPELANYTHWTDNFCVDSPYDYDPVWAKCAELGVSPTFHTPGYGDTRSVPSNWMYNHIGAFAYAGEGICRALLFGGVPWRFPTLRFAFLEGGVGWAVSLYSDMIGHWKKRNRSGIAEYDPANIDRALLQELFARYGGPLVQKRIDRVGKPEMPFKAFAAETGSDDMTGLDEFSTTGIERSEDINAVFNSFYFGCESDDPINASAFNSKANPMRLRFNAVLSSDIGHFDVPDIADVLAEAYEMVEHQLISADDFRDFTFTNPARFWTAANAEFFQGTAVEKAVASVM
jgi:predicted TIM-barrel fold metal-dependent hydrolase